MCYKLWHKYEIKQLICSADDGMIQTVAGITRLRHRVGRCWKRLDHAESRLYLEVDFPRTFLLLWSYKLCKMMMMCLNQCSINLYFCSWYVLMYLNNCAKLYVTRIQRLTARGEKGGINQAKLAGLTVHIAVRLHGVLQQTFKL